jgi:hypothetical protein
MILCQDEDCGFLYNSPALAAANVDGKNDDFKRITDYAINVFYVLGFLSSGDGGVEAAHTLGLLGLPNDTSMETGTLPKIERRISPKLQKLSEDILLENLTEEAHLSITDPNDFEQWKQALKDDAMVLGKAKYAKIDFSFDMGWRQRSSGNRYASPSGDALLVGCKTRKPVAMVVKSKVCNFCKAWDIKMKKLNEGIVDGEEVVEFEPPLHDYCKNHDGTSSSMEPQACLDMVIDLHETKHCIVRRICCDDDASTRSLLRWSNEDYMINNGTTVPPKIPSGTKGKFVTRPNRGKLPGHIIEPTFVTDPDHRKKVFTGDPWKFHGKPVALRYTLT